MSAGRSSLRVHREDVDDDDFRPQPPVRGLNLGKAPVTVNRAQAHNQEVDTEEKRAAAQHSAAAFSASVMADFDKNQPNEDTIPETRVASQVSTSAIKKDDRNSVDGPTRSTQSRVGAVPVPGEATVGAAESLNDDNITVASETTKPLVAEAVASDSLALEIRNDLLYELRQEMQRHSVVAVVQEDPQDRAAPPFWTKKRSRVALLLLLLIVIVGIVVGALAATGVFKDNNEVQCKEDFCSTGSILFSDSNKFTGRDEEDRFGSVVVISRNGGRMAVGAEKGNYARVYQLVGKRWKPKGKPEVIETYPGGDEFGRCVALNREGSILAVGGRNNDDAGENAGHVKVFGHNGTNWLPLGSDLQGSIAGDLFGWCVSLSDDGRTLAVGAKEGDPSNKGDAGYVRVFTYSGNLSYSNMSEWQQLGSDLVGEATEDEFGKSVSLSANGTRLAVGASKALEERGRIQVFDFDGDSNEWLVVGEPLDGVNAKDWLGGAISLSADGSSLAASLSGTEKETGSVRVWELKNSNWTQKGRTLNGEGQGDEFGANFISLSGDGKCLAVGANHFDTDRGKAYLYRWDDSEWQQIATVNGNIPGGKVGRSVAVSGTCDWFAVGATEYDDLGVAPEGSSSNGYVLVYEVTE